MSEKETRTLRATRVVCGACKMHPTHKRTTRRNMDGEIEWREECAHCISLDSSLILRYVDEQTMEAEVPMDPKELVSRLANMTLDEEERCVRNADLWVQTELEVCA